MIYRPAITDPGSDHSLVDKSHLRMPNNGLLIGKRSQIAFMILPPVAARLWRSVAEQATLRLIPKHSSFYWTHQRTCYLKLGEATTIEMERILYKAELSKFL